MYTTLKLRYDKRIVITFIYILNKIMLLSFLYVLLYESKIIVYSCIYKDRLLIIFCTFLIRNKNLK